MTYLRAVQVAALLVKSFTLARKLLLVIRQTSSEMGFLGLTAAGEEHSVGHKTWFFGQKGKYFENHASHYYLTELGHTVPCKLGRKYYFSYIFCSAQRRFASYCNSA